MASQLNDELKTKILSYLEECPDVVPSLVGLCRFTKLPRSNIYYWTGLKTDEGEPRYPWLIEFLEFVNDEQELKLLNGGLSNTYNQTITKLMLANHGYSDKVQQDNVSSDGSMATHFDNDKYKAAEAGLKDLD